MSEQAKLALKKIRENKANGHVPKKRYAHSLQKHAVVVGHNKYMADSAGNQRLIEQLKSLPPHTFKEVRRKK